MLPGAPHLGPNATNTYTIKRSASSGGPYALVADGVKSLTYTDTGLDNGVTTRLNGLLLASDAPL